MIFKGVRLDEVTKRVSFKREEVQRLHLMTLQMLRIQGDDEEPAKETESDQWSKKISRVWCPGSHVRCEGQSGRLCQTLQINQVIWALRIDLEIHLEVIGDLDNCCFNGGDENLECVWERMEYLYSNKENEQTENQLFLDPSKNWGCQACRHTKIWRNSASRESYLRYV